MAKPKGFASWRPTKASKPLLRDINNVLEEYEEYLPLTVRQVFYRLVGNFGYDKTEVSYLIVQDKCNRGRRGGRIPFSSIRDDGVSRLGGLDGRYESPEEYYRIHEELSNYYARCLHADLPTFVAVLCEAAGMAPMLSNVADDYRVEVIASSGFNSLTVKHDLFISAVRRHREFGQNTILLHLGDHDPSGVSVHESMAEDFEAFAVHRGYKPALIELRRVALTPEQITREGIPPDLKGVKPKDSRSKSFIERGLEPAAQLEAIPPDTLSDWLRDAIEDALDMDALRASQEREAEEYEEVQEKLDEVNETLRGVFGLEE